MKIMHESSWKKWHFFGPRNFARGPDINVDEPDPEPNLDVKEKKKPNYLGLEFCRWRAGTSSEQTLHWRIEKKRL